jgi:hypothetical protein
MEEEDLHMKVVRLVEHNLRAAWPQVLSFNVTAIQAFHGAG